MLIKSGYTFVSYSIEAEARALLSIFKDEGDGWTKHFKSIDLYLEYLALLNHNYPYAYGKQLSKTGKVITTKPPEIYKFKTIKVDDDDDDNSKPATGLSAACFKLLGELIDLKEKAECREICIRNIEAEVIASRERIQLYCMSDIKYLPRLFEEFRRLMTTYGHFTEEGWLNAAMTRSRYAVATAKMVSLGYPIDRQKVDKVVQNVPQILKDSAEICLTEGEKVGFKIFRWNPKENRYSAHQATIYAWLKTLTLNWPLTPTGKPQLSLDAFKVYFNSNSTGLGGAFYRHLKTKQSLNGFSAGKQALKFFTAVGPDNRVRPYFNIFGSKTARSQPGSTHYIPLKAHWMRNLIQPPKGRALVGLDYSSQEFLVAAALSQDPLMMAAYASGDVYLAFAKAVGMAPPEATKSSHKKVRDLCKALVLGISYDMGSSALAENLSNKTGEHVTQAKAEELVSSFYSAYPTYANWKKYIQNVYEEKLYLRLSDGWTLWQDNYNFRSVGNFPVQGTGSVIMRKAVLLAQEMGLDVVLTLHDALYIETAAFDFASIEKMKMCMVSAFDQVIAAENKRSPPIKLEGVSWSPDYVDPDSLPKLPDITLMSEYVDDKGRSDLERYRKYLQ
jgi:hypothetical protein